MPEPDPRREERALVARCVEGDAGAWRTLVDGYAGGISARISQVYLQRLGRNAAPSEAQEIAQDVFVRICADRSRSLRAFQWRCSLATYLSAVAATAALDRIRRDARGAWQRPAGVDLDGLEGAEGAPSDEPLEGMRLDESREEVRAAMERLGKRDQLVVRMRYWEGVPPARIAQALGTTPDYVRTILRRSIERLRKEIS